MKEIQYRGILSFRIPRTWVEEQESGGLGVYYLPSPESGTLRVDLLTIEGRGNAKQYASVMEATRPSAPVETLPNGHLLKKYVLADVEESIALKLTFWELARPYPPDLVRLAVFALTQREDLRSQEPAQEELRMIDAEVRIARFIDLHPEAVRQQMD